MHFFYFQQKVVLFNASVSCFDCKEDCVLSLKLLKTLTVLFIALHLQNFDRNGVFANGSVLLCTALFGVKYDYTLQGDLKRDGSLIVLVHKEQLKWKKNYH